MDSQKTAHSLIDSLSAGDLIYITVYMEESEYPHDIVVKMSVHDIDHMYMTIYLDPVDNLDYTPTAIQWCMIRQQWVVDHPPFSHQNPCTWRKI